MNTGETLIKVENLSKKFCRKLSRSMYYGMIDAGRNMIGIPYDTNKLRKDEFWALKDVNFELKKGEALGVIGANGCGKTTLLKLITGIYPPDNGKIITKGKIGALIAVGAGFHPHMTGRENIYLNGTLLGMNRLEIKKLFNDIVEFSEIGEFLDAPVATYSSGMHVKLGFAIAIHINPDILIADEVLAVGDYKFQMKCYDRIHELIKKSAVILVSHNELAIRSVCNKALLLDFGKVIDRGQVDNTLIKYRSILINRREKEFIIDNNTDGLGAINPFLGIALIKKISLLDENSKLIRQNKKEFKKIRFSKNKILTLSIEIEITKDISFPRIYFYIRDLSRFDLTYTGGGCLSSQNSDMNKLTKGEKIINIKFPVSGLMPNIYTLAFGIGDERVHTQIYGGVDAEYGFNFEIIHSDSLNEVDAMLNRPYYVLDYKMNITDT